MQPHGNIEKKVLKMIIPNQKDREKLEGVIQDLKDQVNQEIAKRKLPASIELVGSTAKDTYIKNNLDIDLFLLFPTSFSKQDIAKNSLSIGEMLLINTEESYAEHPYLRGYFKGFKVEIVPCYRIKNVSQKLSAVDRTPLHTEYIGKHLHESQRSEVRLFKQFLTGIGCYGAEAEIEGFSGYLCEILVLKFGSFKNLIQNASHWKPGKKFTLFEGEPLPFDTPITFIDPVDSERNVASAVSIEKFNLFTHACQQYLEKPRLTFFFPNEVQPWPLNKIKTEIQKQDSPYIGVTFSKPEIIDENLYPQIRKAIHSIRTACERYGFNIHDASFYIDELEKQIIIVIKTEKGPLSKTYIHMGPPVKLKKNVEEFINKWEGNPKVVKKPYEDKGRMFVEIEREYVEIKDFLKDIVENLSMGKHLGKIVSGNYDIIGLEDLLSENLRDFWTTYLDEKMSWER